MRNNYLHSILLIPILLFPLAVSAQPSAQSVGAKNDIKVTLLSLGSGSSRFTYERAFSPLNSAELTLGVIGWGWDWLNDCKSNGILVKAAYKWNLIPMRCSDSWLAGFYVKPELVVAAFKYNQRIQLEDLTDPASFTRQVALLAECGYQIVHRWFVFDVYTGLGPSVGTGNDNNYYHSFMLFPDDGWLAFTAGFRIGVAF